MPGMIKLEEPDIETMNLSNPHAEELKDETIMISSRNTETKRARGRPRKSLKSTKVENEMDFKHEVAETGMNIYNSHRKVVKRKAKSKDTVKGKRPKLTVKAKSKPKPDDGGENHMGAEDERTSEKNVPKEELKKMCSLCNGIQLNQGKVGMQIIYRYYYLLALPRQRGFKRGF